MYKIVIADDEQLELMALRQTLEECFGELCEISTTSNGREAAEAATALMADIAVLDIEMPGMNGLEAARRILGVLPQCKVILLTAYSDFSYAKEAITLGLSDYLLKPCSDNDLCNAMEKLFCDIDRIRENESVKDSLMRKIESLTRQLEEQISISVADVASREDTDYKAGHLRHEIELFLKEHFHEEIFLPEMAKTMNYSIAHFSKLFKQLFGRNFVVYLTELRMAAAKELLRSSDMSIREIGEHVGYKEQYYFTRVFRKAVGQTPSEYRELAGAGITVL